MLWVQDNALNGPNSSQFELCCSVDCFLEATGNKALFRQNKVFIGGPAFRNKGKRIAGCDPRPAPNGQAWCGLMVFGGGHKSACREGQQQLKPFPIRANRTEICLQPEMDLKRVFFLMQQAAYFIYMPTKPIRTG